MSAHSLQYRRCSWLLNTIYVHGPITREEIMEYWRRDKDANSFTTSEIPLRTFQKTLRAIEDYFPVTIHCNRCTNEYSVEGAKEAGIKRTRKVSTLDLANSDFHKHDISVLPAQLFRIDAIPEVAVRLREHPICPEQKEVKTDEKGIAIFEYFMKPSIDWYEAVRSLGTGVKVLYPYWISEMIREDARGVVDMYKDQEENKLGRAGFINPYSCQIVEPKKSSLYLSINRSDFEAIKRGNSENCTYDVIVDPENIFHLIEWDWEKDCEVLGENGQGQPLQYKTIHFKAGHDMNDPEAIVEVVRTEVFAHIGRDSKKLIQFVTDENGKVLKDAAGNNISPQFDDDGICTNGTPWNEEFVRYTLGKVLRIWEKK